MLNEVILGYRRVIEERYQYDNLQEKHKLPPSFDKARIALFKNYFLDYIYPHPEQREVLNAAFQNLDNYIQQPSKLLRLLMDSTRLLFKYGRHLPKILKTGLKALRSFRTASQFEQKLVEQAIAIQLKPPYYTKEINQLIKGLPQSEVMEFIDHSQALFETLHDRVLVKKS